MRVVVEKESRGGSRPGSRGGSRQGTPVRTVKIDKAAAAFKVFHITLSSQAQETFRLVVLQLDLHDLIDKHDLNVPNMIR